MKFVCIICKPATVSIGEFLIQVLISLIRIYSVIQQKQLIWKFSLVSHSLFLCQLVKHVTVYRIVCAHLVCISAVLEIPLVATELQNILFL